jgi:hypothetical protein
MHSCVDYSTFLSLSHDLHVLVLLSNVLAFKPSITIFTIIVVAVLAPFFSSVTNTVVVLGATRRRRQYPSSFADNDIRQNQVYLQTQ